MKHFQLYFYRTSSDREIVLEFIRTFSNIELTKIHNDLDLLKMYGLKLLSIPLVKKINREAHLYELRIKTVREIRLFFCFLKPGFFIILHGFIKKTNKTPPKELETATKRAKEFI